MTSEHKSMYGGLSQSEAGYVALSETPGEACANCRWFRPNVSEFEDDIPHDVCHLVDCWPAPILPTGYCERWEERPAPPEPAPLPVVIVEPENDDMDTAEMAALPERERNVADLIVRLKDWLRPVSADEAFTVFKANGRKWWLARHTGKFVDREGEIIADHAHDEYVARIHQPGNEDGTVPLPDLRIWHSGKAHKHGQADLVWKSGGFVCALGHFDTTPLGEAFYEFYRKQRGGIKLSHGFHYPKAHKRGGVYHAYNTFEISTLPNGAEAFPYTSFEELDMSLNEQARQWAKETGGEHLLKLIDAASAKGEADTKALESAGVSFKNYDGATAPPDTVSEEGLKAALGGIAYALKGIEAALAPLPALEAEVKALKLLPDQVSAVQKAVNATMEKQAALEQEIAQLKDVQTPASRANSTLLDVNDKAALARLEEAAKAGTQPSLIDMAMSNRPVMNGGS